MFTNDKKLKLWHLVGLWLLVALFLTSSVSAANPDPANGQQDKVPVPPPPTSYVFEGLVLADVLKAAAGTIQRCGCQNQVSHFAYEQWWGGWHHLTIFMNGLNDPALTTPDTWEIVPFRGTSLSAVLQKAAKYMQDCSCDMAVNNIMYERQTTMSTNALVPAPVHIVSLVIVSPPPN